MSNQAAALLLNFAYDQSYAKTFGEAPPKDYRGVAPPAARECRLPSRRMRPDLGAAIVDVPYPPPAQGTFAHEPSDGSLLQAEQLLYNALGIMRREPSNPYNDHRAFPSPRSLFPTWAFLLPGESGEEVPYRYNPYEHLLEPLVGGGDAAASRTCEDTDEGFSVALAGNYGGLPPYYGSLRYTLALLEAGHCLHNLVLVASGLRLACRVRLAFEDESLRQRLCLPEKPEGWSLTAIVDFGRKARLKDPGRTHDDDVVGSPCIEGSQDASLDGPSDLLSRVEEATWLKGHQIRAWRATGVRSPDSGPVSQDAERRDSATRGQTALAEVIYERNSGRGVAGLSARLSSVPLDTVRVAIREGLRPPPSDVAGFAASAGLRVLVAAQRIDGLADGLYEVQHGDGASLIPVRTGGLFDEVQRAFSYPPASSVNIALLNLAWFLVVDYPEIIERWGPRGFRLASLEMGYVAQGIACALASEGLFARPCRSYHETALDELLRLEPSETVGYEVLCGVNAFRDLLLDLRV